MGVDKYFGDQMNLNRTRVKDTVVLNFERGWMGCGSKYKRKTEHCLHDLEVGKDFLNR